MILPNPHPRRARIDLQTLRGSEAESRPTPTSDVRGVGMDLTDDARQSGDATPERRPDPGEVTQLLRRAESGDAAAVEKLFPLLHEELRRLALREMRGQRLNHTLQATALIHEAYLKLAHASDARSRDRQQFLSLAASAMRSILVDHARAKQRDKRRPDGERIPLEAWVASYEERGHDLIALDDCLQKLAGMDEQLVRLVELRFFVGMGVAEVAQVLGMSKRQTERELSTARAWLKKEMS